METPRFTDHIKSFDHALRKSPQRGTDGKTIRKPGTRQVESDDPIAGMSVAWKLWLPIIPTATDTVQQQDWSARLHRPRRGRGHVDL